LEFIVSFPIIGNARILPGEANSIHSIKLAAVGLLLWARPAKDIDQLLHGAQLRGLRRARLAADECG